MSDHRPLPRGSAVRGRCPVCRKLHRLDTDGRLAQHWHALPDAPGSVESCGGVGYLPVAGS